jgi:hypothetical protein
MIMYSLFIKIGRVIKKIQIILFYPSIKFGKGATIDFGVKLWNHSNKIIIGEGVYYIAY